MSRIHRYRSLKGSGGAAMVVLLLASGLPVCTGSGPATISHFSDGSAEATFYFGEYPETNLTHVTLPRKSLVTSARLEVKGIPGKGGEYPSRPGIALGWEDQTVWEFGRNRPYSDEMGRQRTFSGGEGELAVAFPTGGGSSEEARISLPPASRIKQASLELAGEEAVSAPRILKPEGAPRFVAWNPLRETMLEASVEGNQVNVIEREISSGREMQVQRFPVGSEAYLKDFQYDPRSDSAAFLLPGRGLWLLNLTTGAVRQYFVGPESSSLVAMKAGQGWLATLGSDWASVKDLVQGSEERFSAPDYPEAFGGRPVALDYHPAGRLLFVGLQTAWGAAGVALFRLDDRSLRMYEESSLPAQLVSLLYLPGQETLLLGLGGGHFYGRPMDSAVFSRVLAENVSRPMTAFSELGRVDAMRLSGGVAWAVGYGQLTGLSNLVIYNLSEGSWRTFQPGWPQRGSLISADFDSSNQRLLIGTSGGEVLEFELDFQHRSGRGRLVPPLLSPVPAAVNAVVARADHILLGTESGLAALGPGGEFLWGLDCGWVTALALEPGTDLLAAGSLTGWHLDPDIQDWRFLGANLSVLDLATGPPTSRSWRLEMPAEWGDVRISSLALASQNGALYIGLSGDSRSPGILELNLSTGRFTARPISAPPITSLALSPDGKSLYAGSTHAGLIRMNLASGKEEFLTPFSEPSILSTWVNSLQVDELGRLLVGQGSGYGFYPGLTVLLPSETGQYNATLNYLVAGESQDVRSVASDPSTSRIFLGLGGGGGLVVLDENTGAQLRLGRNTASGSGLFADRLSYSPTARTLAGAGGGKAFALDWKGEFPRNISLDVGSHGSADWSQPGSLDRSVRLDLSSALTTALSTQGVRPGIDGIPLRLCSTSAGIVRLHSLVVTYELAEKVDFWEELSSYLRALPVTEEVAVPIYLRAQGGGLVLFNLTVTCEVSSPPSIGNVPEVTLDASASAPTVIDLSPCFSDDLTSPDNLSYDLNLQGVPPEVEVSSLFGHYLLLDARGTPFRGSFKVGVTARDSEGLSSTADINVRVERKDEYIPPPPAYNLMVWAFAGVLLVLGIWAVLLFFRSYRRKE